jgi:hypothetical protein
MEMQQILQMLAKLQANQDSNQERMAKFEDKMSAKLDSSQEIMAEMNAKMDANHAKAAKQEMLAEMNAKMDANMTKMAAIQYELEEIIERQTKHLMMATWNAHHETTDTEQDPRMMQSVEEHQEVSWEEAAVLPVRGLRKWHSC